MNIPSVNIEWLFEITYRLYSIELVDYCLTNKINLKYTMGSKYMFCHPSYSLLARNTGNLLPIPLFQE